MRLKDIVIIGMMSAMLFAVQIALRIMPNIELVSLLLILFTTIYGRKTLFIIYIFVFLEGFVYGIGEWWFLYLYVWTVLFLISYPLRKERSPFLWAIVSGLFGLSFGALHALLFLFMGGPSIAFAKWISGIPFDIIHGISNFILVLVLYQPIYYILNKLNKTLNTPTN